MSALTIHAPVLPEERGYVLWLLEQQDDDESRCTGCLMPTDPDELADIDGGICLPCLTAIYGEDVYGPCHSRDF